MKLQPNLKSTLKRIVGIFLAASLLLCAGCGNMTTEDLFMREAKCDEAQAQEIWAVLQECGASELESYRAAGALGRMWELNYPEGDLLLITNDEKEVRSLEGYAFKSMYLYRNDGYHESGYLGRLITSPAERQYYLDVTQSMVESVQDILTTTDIFGSREEAPLAFTHDGEHFAYRTQEGAVRAGYILYGTTERNRVRYLFEAEFAMLYPTSLKLDIPNFGLAEVPDEQMLYYVWDESYYDTMYAQFGSLAAEAARHTQPFTEEELNQARQTLATFGAEDKQRWLDQ